MKAAGEDTQYQIDEVWALDAVQHGDAGLINAQDLGALCVYTCFFTPLTEVNVFLVTWSDHARDILNFILHFLPETVLPSTLPTYLPRVPLEVSTAREKRGFTSRELVVVGHSFSGCAACVLLIPRGVPSDA